MYTVTIKNMYIYFYICIFLVDLIQKYIVIVIVIITNTAPASLCSLAVICLASWQNTKMAGADKTQSSNKKCDPVKVRGRTHGYILNTPYQRSQLAIMPKRKRSKMYIKLRSQDVLTLSHNVPSHFFCRR